MFTAKLRLSIMFSLLFMLSIAGNCQQMLIWDYTYTWKTKGNWGDNDIFPPNEGTEVWADHGFTEPHLYMKLTVTGRPTTDKLCLWLCLWNSTKVEHEVCAMEGRTMTDGSGIKVPCHAVTNDGTYYFDYYKVRAWRASHSGSHTYDCSMPLKRILPQFRINGAKLHDGASTGHVPFDAHFEIVIVEEGKQMVTPDGWECPPEWNCDGSTGAAGRQTRGKANPAFLKVTGNSCAILCEGTHTMKLMNVNGRVLEQRTGCGRTEYHLGTKNNPATGMMLLSVENEKESAIIPIMMKN